MREDAFGGGLVDLLVLAAVEGRGESYGYAIAQDLAEAGVTGLGEAAVYACLRRLHKRELLTSRQVVADNGKARRYYALTPAGRAHRDREQATWEATRDAVMKVLATGGGA